MTHLYDIFTGKDLEIAEHIQKLRLQMLIHSYIYYRMDDNIISDFQWSSWGVELARLQNEYPKIARKVSWANEFADWDGSSGAALPLDDPWVKGKAEQVMKIHAKLKVS